MSVFSSLVEKIPGIGHVLNQIAKPIDTVANAALNSNPITGGILGAAQAIGNYIPNPLGGTGGNGAVTSAQDLLGQAGQFLTGNGGMNALGVAQGINAAQLQQKSNQYATNAMGDVNASYNERAPLRAQALGVLPSAIAANPFARGGTIKGSNGVAPQSITMANG